MTAWLPALLWALRWKLVALAALFALLWTIWPLTEHTAWRYQLACFLMVLLLESDRRVGRPERKP